MIVYPLFNSVIHKSRQKMWRRPIVPLTDEERDNHLFRIPDDPKRFRVLPELGHSLGERSMTLPQMTGSMSALPSQVDPRVSQLTVPSSFNDPSLRLTTDHTGLVSKQQTGDSSAVTNTPQMAIRPAVTNNQHRTLEVA